jgi:hypothetical protein
VLQCRQLNKFNERREKVEQGKVLQGIEKNVTGTVRGRFRCIKTDYFKNCGRFCFYAKELNKDLWKMIQMMTEKGIKVTIK